MYAFWTLRGTFLIGSVLSAMPAWQTFDPLPVLDFLNRDEEDGESLESIVDEAKQKTT